MNKKKGTKKVEYDGKYTRLNLICIGIGYVGILAFMEYQKIKFNMVFFTIIYILVFFTFRFARKHQLVIQRYLEKEELNMEENQLLRNDSSLSSEGAESIHGREDLTKNEELKQVSYDGKDVLLALIYILIGYLWIRAFMANQSFGLNIAVFTVIYVVTVLVYAFIRKINPTKESYFWMVILLGIGIPYSLWSVMELLQILAFIGVAAYWTLSVTGTLQEHGKTSQWVVVDIFNACIMVPFSNITVQLHILIRSIQKTHFGKGILAAGLGLCIVLPILLVVLPLLSGADAGFNYLMNQAIDYIREHFLKIVVQLIIAIPVGAYLFGMHYGGLYGRNVDKISKIYIQKSISQLHRIPNIAINTAMITLCLVYLLFICLQGTYLFSAFAGVRPEEFTYADYARRGFFELCTIASINVGILLGANAFSKTMRSQNAILRWFNVILSALTLLLIATALSKMFLYIGAYGLTVKRVLTSMFMLWQMIVFFLTIIWQWRKIPIIRWAVFCGAILFCLLCVLPVENFISLYNLKAGR